MYAYNFGFLLFETCSNPFFCYTSFLMGLTQLTMVPMLLSNSNHNIVLSTNITNPSKRNR